MIYYIIYIFIYYSISTEALLNFGEWKLKEYFGFLYFILFF